MKVFIKKLKLDFQVKMFVFWNLIFEINLILLIKIDIGFLCCIFVYVQYVNSYEKYLMVMLYFSFKLFNMFLCQIFQIFIFILVLYGEVGFVWVERNVMVIFYVYVCEYRIVRFNCVIMNGI